LSTHGAQDLSAGPFSWENEDEWREWGQGTPAGWRMKNEKLSSCDGNQSKVIL